MFIRIGNGLIKAIRKSRFHRLMSSNTLVIEYRGMKSGRSYSTPVNYVRKNISLLISSLRSRIWWRNLIQSAEVSLILQGTSRLAIATSYVGEGKVAALLEIYLHAVPRQAKYFKVNVEEDGTLLKPDLERAAQERVMISVSLS